MDNSDVMNGIAPKDRVITDQIAGHITRVDELFYELKIADVMSTQPRTISPDERMADALDLLRREQFREPRLSNMTG